MDFKANMTEIQSRSLKALAQTGRSLSDITMIAVSKTVPIQDVQLAVDAGITHLGENRVQELTSKFDDIKGKVQWHFIGTLQRNKVKYILDKVAFIHSLDNIRLAGEIHRQAKLAGILIKVFIQINVGREDSKSGISPEELPAFLEAMKSFENVKICGLMAIPPFHPDLEAVRPYFKEMKQLFDAAKSLALPHIQMDYLSMGMTYDYEIALQEGANIIRIGTGIFGSRKKEE